MSEEWATITDSTIIAAGGDADYCNETIIKLIGTDSLAVDAATLVSQNGWASGTDDELVEYTDGYRVFVTMTIQNAP
jgi:hypothetical protein